MSNARPIDVNQLVESCLERLEHGDTAGVEEILRDHPEHDKVVRDRLGRLRDMGLLDDVAATAGPPERLGPFRLLERIGGGGMGVVYLAEQDALGRRVALKLIRPDLVLFDASRERFRREVEVVAQLEHPAIVPVYVVGDDGGVPYYAMEHIEGKSLDEVIDDLRGGKHERLTGENLLASVCPGGSRAAASESARLLRSASWGDACARLVATLADAVAHAHGHGVLHRDIKPSNIMLRVDGRVVLLDFGLASSRASAKLTRTGSQLGSLPYMAPEQLRDEPVEERTDVYSLGVTLYELLTLSSPFLAPTTEGTRRRILAGAPPAVRQLNPALSWDVETVCLKAMEPAPARRYPSAVEFAADLLRVLERQPIQARRPGRGLRAWRWMQRHPTSTVAAALGFLLVVGGPSAFAVREHFVGVERDAARRALAAEAQIQRATLEFLNEDLLQAVRPDRAGRDVSMREALDLAAERIGGRFEDQPRVKASVLTTIGTTYRTLGVLTEAEHHLEQAEALLRAESGDESLPWAAVALELSATWSAQGQHGKAEPLCRRALDVRSDLLGEDHALTLTAANDLGLLLTDLMHFAEAEPILHRVFEARSRRLGAEDPGTLITMANLGKLYKEWGRLGPATEWTQREYETCLRVRGERHPETLISMNNMAVLLDTVGEKRQAAALFRRVAALCSEVLGEHHPDTIERWTAVANGLLREDVAQGEALLLRCLENGQPLGDEHPAMLKARSVLVVALFRQQRFAEAEELLGELVTSTVRARGSDHPESLSVRTQHAMALQALGRTDEALAQFEAALDVAPATHSPFYHGQALLLLGRLLVELERYPDAERRYLEAFGILDQSLPEHDIVAVIATELAGVYDSWGKPAEAARWRARLAERVAAPAAGKPEAQ